MCSGHTVGAKAEQDQSALRLLSVMGHVSDVLFVVMQLEAQANLSEDFRKALTQI